MPEYISYGDDWYHVSKENKLAIEQGSSTKASVVTANTPKKRQ
jgi:hypothetical protein